MLLAHVGANPSIVQRVLISRACRLALHLELLDERALTGEYTPFKQHDSNYYVAWSNSLARLLGKLGIRAPDPQMDAVEYGKLLNARRATEAA